MALAWRLEVGYFGYVTALRVGWVGAIDRLESQNSRSCISYHMFSPISEIFIAILFMEILILIRSPTHPKFLERAQESGIRR